MAVPHCRGCGTGQAARQVLDTVLGVSLIPTFSDVTAVIHKGRRSNSDERATFLTAYRVGHKPLDTSKRFKCIFVERLMAQPVFTVTHSFKKLCLE
jgi:hypothetical protein